MKGGYVHNRLLLAPVDRRARELGARVDHEVAINVGDRVLFGDLVINLGSRRILVEAEMSSRRIPKDVAKASALEGCELWILVPNPRVAASVRRKLERSHVRMEPRIFVFSLPQALQRLGDLFHLNFGSNEGEKTEEKETGN